MRPASGVTWSVETRGVTLWSRSGTRLSIPYPHAGLWALVANGNYSSADAAELMSVLMSTGERQAAREVEKTLAAWKGSGLVTEA